MRKKRQQIEQPARQDGFWWILYHIPLRGGHYHHEWLPALVECGRIQLGSNCSIPLSAPILHNALWRGPIEPPPLDDPPRTALALERGGNRQKRKNRSEEDDFTDAERQALSLGLLAGNITELFLQSSKDLLAGTTRISELVDRVEELLHQAFGSDGG